jgi:hypothetical protein
MFKFQVGENVKLDNFYLKLEYVIFDLSYYENHKWKLKVSGNYIPKRHKDLRTECQALALVEEWLSQPVTEDYFNMIKDDTNEYHSLTNLKIRGDVLGEKKHIYKISYNPENNTLHLFCDVINKK